MSSSEDVEIWLYALKLYEEQSFVDSISEFKKLKCQTARIQFNIGCCYLSLRNELYAMQPLVDALSFDPYFALTQFLLAQLHYGMNKLQHALDMYEECYKNLRGNKSIDYHNLGLNYSLHASEVILNQALIYRRLGRQADMNYALMKASKFAADERKLKEIKVSSESIQRGDDYIDVYRFPLKELFRPDQRNAKNFNKKNFLGEAKVLSTSNKEQIYACFSGVKMQQEDEISNSDHLLVNPNPKVPVLMQAVSHKPNPSVNIPVVHLKPDIKPNPPANKPVGNLKPDYKPNPSVNRPLVNLRAGHKTNTSANKPVVCVKPYRKPKPPIKTPSVEQKQAVRDLATKIKPARPPGSPALSDKKKLVSKPQRPPTPKQLGENEPHNFKPNNKTCCVTEDFPRPKKPTKPLPLFIPDE